MITFFQPLHEMNRLVGAKFKHAVYHKEFAIDNNYCNHAYSWFSRKVDLGELTLFIAKPGALRLGLSCLLSLLNHRSKSEKVVNLKFVLRGKVSPSFG